MIKWYMKNIIQKHFKDWKEFVIGAGMGFFVALNIYGLTTKIIKKLKEKKEIKKPKIRMIEK